MPNDLKIQRNLLNLRPESRPESRSESRPRSESQRQKLASSGFTASIWTLSGVVLVACSNVEDFLGIDDGGGGGGGRALHVHSSPVQGARIYFDVDGGGVSADEMAAQDAEYPQGFISNAEGRVTGVPSKFYGMPFEAHLDGAFDSDTGESLSGILHSIPNPNEDGRHTLASPITEYFSDTDLTVEQLMTDIEDILPTDANEAEDVTAFLEQILDPTSYDGSSGIDILARYLDGGGADAAAEFARVLGASPTATFTAVPSDPTVTIGAHDEYVTTIEVESPNGAVTYSIEPADSGAFTISARGVISVVTTPTADTTLRVMVSNDNPQEDPIMVEVAVTVTTSLPTLTPASDAPTATSATMGEDTAGGTDLISGITASSGITADDFVIRTPDADGLASKFEIVEASGAFNLALKANEKLDFEALPTGTITLQVQAKDSVTGVRSEPLELTITVTGVNDAPVFLPAPEDNEQNLVGDGGTIETPESERGTVARVRAHDADGDSVTYSITDGNTGDVFSIDNSGAISVASGATLDYEDTTSYTLTITATDGGTPALTDTMMLTIDLTDINDVIPTYTPSGDASVRIVTAADNTAGASTGYSITISDADADATNTFGVSVRGDSRDRFEFRDQGAGVWELFLKTGETVDEAEGATITLTYTVSDGDNTAATTTAQPGTVSIDVVDSPIKLANTPYTGTINEDGTSATLPTIMASVDGASGHRFGYEFVSGGSTTSTDQGFSIGNLGGAITFTGTAGTDLDYEATPDGRDSITLTVRVTYDADGSSNTTDDRETRDVQVVIDVGNVEEGEATYEIVLTDDNGATVTDLAAGVTLTPMVATDGADPDGLDRVVSYLWSRSDGSSLNGDATGATYTLTAGDSTTATYSVTITYIDGTDKTEVVEASTSSVSFDTMPVHDAAMYPLTDGMATMDQYLVIPAAQITASGGDGKIEYSIDRDASSFGNAWFSVNPIDGSILVNEDRPAVWDYETVQTVELVIVATDVDDGSTMGTGDTARIPVTINITDANDAPVVEGVQVTANDPLAMAGAPTITGLTGTTADEYIEGTAGADTIASGGGADHIIGGAGDDEITLSTAVGSVETIYHRFSSSNSGDFAPTDGYDTITNFRRGEDKIVLIDTDSSVITLTDFLSAANTAGSGGNVEIVPLFDSVTGTTLIGVQIGFGSTNAGRFLRIEYATDSQVANARAAGQGAIEAAGVPYLGTLGEGLPSGGLIEGDNSLLLNYFGDTGNTNLQITGDDITANLGIDVLISEKRNAEDGFFATVSASDPDAAPNNVIMRYDISGGTGSALFTVDVMGRISVSDGVNVEGGSRTLDYDTTSEYTLEITATDVGGETSDPTTITIGLINSESEYSLALAGTTLTATEDTADPDGVQTNTIMYRWFTTPDEGTTKNYIGAASATNTYDTDMHTPPANEIYGVEVTYTDDSSNDETVDVLFDDTLLEWNFQNSARSNGITTATTHVVSIGSQNLIDAASMTRISDASGTISYGITDITGTGAANLEVRSDKLYLKSGKTLTAGTYEIQVTATEDVTDTSITATITITVSAASPAIIPDRQAFAHQDPYEPNDDQNDQTNQDNPQTPPDIM